MNPGNLFFHSPHQSYKLLFLFCYLFVFSCVQDITLLTQNAVVYPTEDGRLSTVPIPPSGQVCIRGSVQC
jgi:hypothetical protein